jgi:uncharacterized protein (DUF3820 family)
MFNTDEARKELIELANTRMYYGKFKGRLLIQIPEEYYVWYKGKGFPDGKLGKQMEQMLEIKLNGLENLIYPLIHK